MTSRAFIEHAAEVKRKAYRESLQNNAEDHPAEQAAWLPLDITGEACSLALDDLSSSIGAGPAANCWRCTGNSNSRAWRASSRAVVGQPAKESLPRESRYSSPQSSSWSGWARVKRSRSSIAKLGPDRSRSPVAVDAEGL